MKQEEFEMAKQVKLLPLKSIPDAETYLIGRSFINIDKKDISLSTDFQGKTLFFITSGKISRRYSCEFIPESC